MNENALQEAATSGDSEQKEILSMAMDRFAAAQEASNEWRSLATIDLRFSSNDQWDDGARRDREVTGRPCFTEDHISPAVRQIVNESRQNRPSIEVDPKGDGADVDTSMVIAGLIRDIEYQSNADTAYDIAEEYAVRTGLGYFRLVPEYAETDSFDQVLRIKQIEDPLTVYMDPDHKEQDGSDAEWAFVVRDISKTDFTRLYPEADMQNSLPFDLNNNGWVSDDTVRVAEYFYKEYKSVMIYHVKTFAKALDGSMMLFNDEVTRIKPTKEELDSQTKVIVKKRKAEQCTVKWLVINGKEVLSETIFPGQFIPVFPVKGEEFWVDNKRVIMGAVRRAIDSQKIINFMVSSQVEAIDMGNKVPYIGAAGQFEGFEDRWRNANNTNYAYLEYNTVDVDGKPIAPPTRQSVETPIQAIQATRQQSDNSMKQIFGIYESATGAQSNETSGVAIIARKEQSSNSNFHYYDNLVRAIKHLGRVLVEVIPTYYDTARTVRIVKPNGEQELTAINQYLENGKIHKMEAGLYAVVVKTGPSYMTKRQKLVENGTALISQYPQAGPLIADLLVQASDFEGAQEMAARLRTQVPPEVLAASGESGAGVDPKAQIQSLTVQLQGAQKNLEQLNEFAKGAQEKAQFLEKENQLLKEENKLDVLKAEGDYNIKSRQLALTGATTDLEFTIKQQELAQKQQLIDIKLREIAIKEAELKITATTALMGVVTQGHETAIKHIDRAAVAAAGGPADLTVGGTDTDIGTIDSDNTSGLSSVDLGGKIGYDTL